MSGYYKIIRNIKTEPGIVVEIEMARNIIRYAYLAIFSFGNHGEYLNRFPKWHIFMHSRTVITHQSVTYRHCPSAYSF